MVSFVEGKMELTIQPERRRYLVRRFSFLKNFSVRARLFGAGALALAGLMVTGGAGYVGLTQSNDGLAASITATTAVLNQKHADMMHDALRGDVLYALRAGPAAPAAIRAEIEADLQTHVAEFAESMANLRTLELPAKIEADVLAATPPLDAYIAAAQDITAQAFRDIAAAQALWPEFMVAFSTLEDTMGILGEEIEAEGNSTALAAQDRNESLLTIIIVAISACAAVILLSNVLLARSITIPIRRIKEAIGQVIAGNYDGRNSSFDRASDKNDEITQISGQLEVLRERLRNALVLEETIRSSQAGQVAVVDALSVGLADLSQGRLTDPITEVFPDEYESLRANFNVTIDRLNDSLTEIAKASRTIRGQADDITTAAEDLAHRTENQAATLEQTAAALDALTGSVKAAANGAREVERIVQNTRSEAEESNRVVVQAVEAMNGIERSSEQISRIIGVIEDIAFQTNLLALNAGVEAARAGETGRGFAVVASEVRALAQRSADASHEIKELITSSTQFVDRGVESVGMAGKVLGTIVDRVGHISDLVSNIAAGAVQQSTALGEVNIGVTQLDQVAQRNAAMVEQSMSTTQALQQEAMGLDAIMSRFVTRGSGAMDIRTPLRRAG
ncbi:MAG: methyl-accepting chemotaxis protein [Paracoccaceae bacterium]